MFASQPVSCDEQTVHSTAEEYIKLFWTRITQTNAIVVEIIIVQHVGVSIVPLQSE